MPQAWCSLPLLLLEAKDRVLLLLLSAAVQKQQAACMQQPKIKGKKRGKGRGKETKIIIQRTCLQWLLCSSATPEKLRLNSFGSPVRGDQQR